MTLSWALLITAICMANTLSAQTKLDSETMAREKYNEGVVEGSQVGSLICKDANGKFVLCTGSDYEKVQGFATSAPFVTINKPAMGEKANEFSAIVSVKEGGAIKRGDRLTAGTTPGSVRKCTELDVPIAIALTDAESEGAIIKVKALNIK
ncbi:hypothetical protein BH09BAC1_BH09BAC1_23890 [soil metagenome]